MVGPYILVPQSGQAPLEYPVDNAKQIYVAKLALQEAGVPSADVWTGEGAQARKTGATIPDRPLGTRPKAKEFKRANLKALTRLL